jgi:23S rRNA (guanosine2251-2'-O)-methyltransferase
MQNHKTKQHSIKNKKKSNHDSGRNNQNGGNQDGLWLCGKHPIFTILQKKRRNIFEILATKNTVSDLENFLKNNSLNNLKPLIKVVDNDRIESLFGKNQPNQGLAIRASRIPTKNQNDLLEELHAFEEGDKLPTLLLLDQISDPHNVGAIIRSAVSFGVKKIIFSEHNSPKENATIVKSSAGTIELVDLVIVTNFNNLIEKLKKIGYWCIGLAGEAVTPITAIKEYKNIALIIGSEGDGMRDLVKKNCDILARIEIDKEVESLNASVAASIALYELLRS